jgi:hypothetical protein
VKIGEIAVCGTCLRTKSERAEAVDVSAGRDDSASALLRLAP